MHSGVAYNFILWIYTSVTKIDKSINFSDWFHRRVYLQLETNKQVNSSVGEWISRLADDHRVLQLRASTLSNLTEDIVNGTLMIASDTILQAQQTVNSTQSLMQQNVVSQAGELRSDNPVQNVITYL